METGTKRPAGSDKSVFAVCSKCTRLSQNTQICESCGHSLSEDNTAAVCSSDPKRPRSEAASAASLVNGSSISINHADLTRLANSSNFPPNQVAPAVPMADGVRPQALYVNLNNQAFPVVGVSDQSTSISSTTIMSRSQNELQMPLIGSALAPAVPNLSAVAPGMALGMQPQVMSQMPTPSVMNLRSVATNGAAQSRASGTQLTSALPQHPQVSLPGYNLQPPTFQTPHTAQPSHRIPQGQPIAQSIQSASASSDAPIPLTNVPAYQIRIGSRKFKPLSTVQFKEDGVLFTLKNFTFAPVLLNARAIIRCKANLKYMHYPVILLYLEGSCMRQIRNIFELSENEFSETSSVDLKRCITIFPQLDEDAKIAAQMIKGITQSFERMLLKYPRANQMLELISNDEAIDLITGTCISGEADPRPSRPPLQQQQQQPAAAATRAIHTPNPTSSSSSSLSRHATPSNTASASLRTVLNRNVPLNSSNPSSSAAQQPVVPMSGTNAAPMLTVPNDEAKWQEMQKNLVAGGVYFVQMPSGQRRYCLWSGKQLVPCHVQNMEVQLSVKHICIGKAIFRGADVRIKSDAPAGITIFLKSLRKNLQMAAEELHECKMCVVNGVNTFFIQPDRPTTIKLCVSFGFNLPEANEFPRRWFIAMMVEDVNSDQREALQQMRHPLRNSMFFEDVPSFEAVKMYASSLENTKVLQQLEKHAQQRGGMTTAIIANLIESLIQSEVNGAPAADDDDDDVIMTSEEVGVKCPYTQSVMKEPIRNKICGHNYEKAAIHEFILRKKGNAKCPYAGCGNREPLRTEDLEDNLQLKEYIQKNKPS